MNSLGHLWVLAQIIDGAKVVSYVLRVTSLDAHCFASRVDVCHWIVQSVSIEVDPAVEASWVVAQEPACLRVVVSGAIV
jgi:hypothetical protein